MTPDVALAMLHRQVRWQMQLRNDIPGTVAPGCCGLFGGHLDRGETHEQVLRRELQEEIAFKPGEVHIWWQQRNHHRPGPAAPDSPQGSVHPYGHEAEPDGKTRSHCGW